MRAVNQVRPTWRLLGFLDDNPALRGVERAGLPVLGGLETLADRPAAAVLVCVGNPGTGPAGSASSRGWACRPTGTPPCCTRAPRWGTAAPSAPARCCCPAWCSPRT
ncbi:hypothetical protein GCM10027605_60420 [Micromonospora zhanjiangensis]